MQAHMRTVEAPAHCTLCALGIPGHVGQGTAAFEGGMGDIAGTPVQVYLQRRRLGLPTALVSAGS